MDMLERFLRILLNTSGISSPTHIELEIASRDSQILTYGMYHAVLRVSDSGLLSFLEAVDHCAVAHR